MMEARLLKPGENGRSEDHMLIKEEHDDGQPLDFSNKRDSLTRSSKAEEEALRKFSHDSGISISSNMGETSNNPLSRSPTPSSMTNEEQKQLIGEPRVSLPGMTQHGFPPVTMTNTMAAAGMGMGVFPGMNMPGMAPGSPGFPGFPSPFMPPGFNPMWHNHVAAAALMQQHEAARKVLQTSNSNGSASTTNTKTTPRPFKQYPKDPLNFSLCSMPGLLPGAASLFPNGVVPDASAFAEAVKSHEQMFNAYKQQVLSQKAAEDAKKHTRRNSALVISSPSPISQPSVPHSQQNSPAPVNGNTPLSNGNTIGHPPVIVNDNSTSSFPEDDKHSIASGKSSVNGDTPQLSNSSEENNMHIPDYDSSQPKRKMAISSGIPPAVATDSNDSCHSPISSTMSAGHVTPSNALAPTGRKRSRTLPDDQKDSAYWERRRKNNEAAKRSRDTRRAKEDEIAIRAAFLEQENLRLRVELAALRQQTAKLRSELVMYQSPDIDQNGEKGPADGS